MVNKAILLRVYLVVSIILFLSLVNFGWTIVKFSQAIYNSREGFEFDLKHTFISMIITAFCFSYFYNYAVMGTSMIKNSESVFALILILSVSQIPKPSRVSTNCPFTSKVPVKLKM